eukprot:gene3723-14998_t
MADTQGEQKTHEAENGEAAASNPTSDEDRLLQAARDKDISEVTRLSSQWNIKIDYFDKNGMTALMHAAYKGDNESLDVLITHGADVNRKSSDHGYTPLMFATLAGSTECVQLLLDAGADPSIENKIGKTATQLGAFVGRHDCVSLINNYIARHDIEYYTKPQGLEKEPKLASFLAEPLQRFIIITNLHPVFAQLDIAVTLAWRNISPTVNSLNNHP